MTFYRHKQGRNIETGCERDVSEQLHEHNVARPVEGVPGRQQERRQCRDKEDSD